MPAITASVTLRIPPELLEVIDSCRGDISRNEWMVTALQWAYANRGAVERALGESSGGHHVPESRPSPAPAEQPETPDFIREGGMASASSYLQRDFRPYPKGGKR